jgi:hypothetical protein
LFVVACVLSRGVDQIRKDMDMPMTSLIVEHGYCAQELVNLLLIGKAHSNVFDNIQHLGTGKDKQILKGIPQRSDVGFLSLLEKYDYIKVGENYKSPKYPIFVLYSESHYSLLFAKEAPKDNGFDLFYFDQLGNQDEEIRLTVTPNARRAKADMESPIEECIRTKWKDSLVDWNGTEPLL